jgi:replication factor C large subunit
MWVDKHRPTTLKELQGNNKAIGRLKDWLNGFPEDTEPQLLEGAPGTGKTSTVEVLADYAGYDMVELNASSARKSDDIEDMAKTVQGSPIDAEYRIVLLDEVDSWHHGANLKPLYDALDDPNNPVFLTCNDKWETPSALVSRCNVEEFRLQKRSRRSKLKKIRDAEGLDLPDDVLDALSERPDLRSAINDLQMWATADPEDIEDQRRWNMSEWDMVDAMMTGTAERGQHRPGEALMWLDENLSKDWRGLELAWGHEALSRCDVAIMRDKRAAEAIIDTLPALRLTEPYNEDGIGRSKEFPEWFRHSKPDATGGSDEAHLYRELSNYDSGEPGLLCSFTEFRERVLPQLQALDAEQKHEMILTERLSPDAYAALDITEAQHEAWVEEEAPEEGDGLSRTESASAW